jgi:hypothetical protein
MNSLKNEICIKPLRVRSDESIYGSLLIGYFPLSAEKVKLSTVVGAGLMHADFKYGLSVSGLPDKISIFGSDDGTDLCGKVGLGLNFFAFQDISLGIEGNYIFGFDDLVDIMYFNFTIGAAYHF